MNNRISFAVDADSVSLKSIYKKDFLELQMRAISTANPNLNGSWFTTEALQDAIESCKNKPILGYFNSDGDFESHNGVWRKDIETGMDYWDTKNGEQVLGLIRENDDIKVVHGEDGLDWLCLSCALWTQYNFKQVKRLIKDAKRAKANGGVTKNISVEIDILEGEKQEDGVYRIDKFKLAGITILGSRQGQKIEPGIANAALSIPEIMGTDFYAKQQNMLRAAYARLGTGNENDKVNNKEGVLKMEDAQNVKLLSSEENDDKKVCEKCGQDPCVCVKDDTDVNNENNKVDNCGHMEEDTPAEAEENKACEACDDDAGANTDPDDSDKTEDKDEDEDEDNKDDEGDDEDKTDAKQNCGSYEDENPEENVMSAEDATTHETCDIAWLISNMNYNFREIEETIGFYSLYTEEPFPHKDYIMSVLTRVLNNQKCVQSTLGALLNAVAGDISEADEMYEKKLTKNENVDELIAKYEEAVKCNKDLQDEKEQLSKDLESCKKERDEYKKRINTYEHEKFLGEIKSLLDSTGNLDEKDAKEIYSACKDGSLKDYEEVKTKVALKVFEAQQNYGNTNNINTSFHSPVYSPDIKGAFEAKAEKSSKRNSWDILSEYNGKKK